MYIPCSGLTPEAIARAIECETASHIDPLERGTETLVQETRRWDDVKGRSFAMRNNRINTKVK